VGEKLDISKLYVNVSLKLVLGVQPPPLAKFSVYKGYGGIFLNDHGNRSGGIEDLP
jgi:hypothetical protein